MKAQNKQTMKAQYSFTHKTRLPGFGLYVLDKSSLFLNAKAVEMLGLDPKFANTWAHPRTILRQFSMPIVHKVISFVRQLKDAKCDTNLAKEIEINSFRLRKLKLDSSDIDSAQEHDCSCLNKCNEETEINTTQNTSGEPQLAVTIDPFFPKADHTSEQDSHYQYYVESNHICLNGLGTKEQKLKLKQYLKGLTPCDSASFAIVLDKGELKGKKVYIKFRNCK